jgi:hypothetical protein
VAKRDDKEAAASSKAGKKQFQLLTDFAAAQKASEVALWRVTKN